MKVCVSLKNGASRSLRAALWRFAELAHLIRPQKCRYGHKYLENNPPPPKLYQMFLIILMNIGIFKFALS